MLERWWAKDVDLIKDNGRETERQILNSFGLKYRPEMARVKVVKCADLMPVLREARAIAEVLERITHCKSGWNKQAKSFLDLTNDIDATKGVEG